MSDKYDYYLVIGPIEKGLDGYTAEDRKEWLEDAGWKDVQIVWADEQNVDYQLAYAAGRKAEREWMQLKNWDGIRLGTTKLEGEG